MWFQLTAQSESILLSTCEEEQAEEETNQPTTKEQPEEDLANNHNQNQRPLATTWGPRAKVGIFSNQWWITKTNDCKIWHEILLWRYVPLEVQAASFFHSAHWLLRIQCKLMLTDAFWVTLPTKSIKVPYNSLAIKKRKRKKKVRKKRNLLLAKRSLSDEKENKITVWIYWSVFFVYFVNET